MNNIDYLPIPNESFFDQMYRLYPEDKRKVGQITFQVTENCCLACTYCYQHNKTNNKINFDIAKKVIDKLLNNEYEILNTNNVHSLVIEFIGGEPFMEIDLISKITDYFFEQAISLKHEWAERTKISLCSNGILYFEEKVQEYFQKYYNIISFCVSIDGNKELHDSCRLDLQGKGSYDRAIAAVQHYKQQYHNPYIRTKMTLAPENLKFLFPSILNLLQIGYKVIDVNCVYENVWQNKDAQLLYEELCKISDYIIENNLYNKINIALLNDEEIGTPMNPEDNNNWCGGVITEQSNFSVDHEGNFYSCLRYMNSSLNGRQKPLNIGNIEDGFASNKEEKNNLLLLSNITRRSQSTDECFYCPIGKGCSWCSAFNYEETGTPNKRVTYICIMHKARVLANIYYWNKLYKKLNIDKKKTNYLSKEEIISIIGEKNYNNLLQFLI